MTSVEYVMSESVFQAYLAEAWEHGLTSGLRWAVDNLRDPEADGYEHKPDNPYWKEAEWDELTRNRWA